MQETPTPSPIPPPPSYHQPRRKSNWWIPLAVIGGLLLVIFIGVALIFGAFASSIAEMGGSLEEEPSNISSKTVLVVDLSQGVVDYRPPVAFSFSEKAGINLSTVLNAIEDAKTDDNISGILIRNAGPTGMTKLAEIREAIVDFKSSKKFVYAYLNNGEKRDYYLATAADSVFMQAEGLMEFNALGATGVFMNGLMNNIGVDWYVQQFEEYKSAAEQMSRDSWSAPAKEAIREIIVQRQEMFVDAVASGRNMDKSTVVALLNEGIFIPDSLLVKGLIDGLTREDELRERIAKRLDPSDTTDHPKLRVASIGKYSRRADKKESKIDEDHAIAIVYASGAISEGKNESPFETDGIYSKTLIKDLKKAWKNDDVDAIVIRIDSPGGSALASDEIWATIKEIRKDKPVYASMSDVAASGGYYIAMACDSIFASPSTITGSIGVIMAIPNFTGTMNKIGVTTDTISLGKSSEFITTVRPLSSATKQQLHNFGEGIYKRFVQKVADSRGMSYDDTRALAKGRVWTGAAAKKAGLVDVLADFEESIDIVKKRIGVAEGKKVRVFVYPEQVDNLTALLSLFGIDRDDDEETSSPSITVQQLMSVSQQRGVPFKELYDRLPADAQAQIRHSITITDLALQQPVMTILPFSVPQL